MSREPNDEYERYSHVIFWEKHKTTQPSFPITSSRPSYSILEVDEEKGMRLSLIYPQKAGLRVTESIYRDPTLFTNEMVGLLERLKDVPAPEKKTRNRLEPKDSQVTYTTVHTRPGEGLLDFARRLRDKGSE